LACGKTITQNKKIACPGSEQFYATDQPFSASKFARPRGPIVFFNITTKRLLSAALTAAALGGCAQVNTGRSELTSVRQHAALVPVKKRLNVFAKNGREPRSAAVRLASYYTEGSRTASGEKLIPGELTAAHPTLPFGTRLRVTSLGTGRSVVVRVNDRGPFVKGVDLSPSAAEHLGLIQRGVAKVKVDVVQ
jgi:rare lipoprotein A